MIQLQSACRFPAVDEVVATARFRFANLVLGEDDPERAKDLYTHVLADCDPAWPVFAGILNNRGITWLELNHADQAIADFTAVINATVATDEARACAFNNRADIHDDRGDTTAAIADRSAVLKLNETTYDRRYIALARRARTLWKADDHDGALRDVDAILSTADIVMEQKMAALLQRARWLVSDAPERAITDLETVLSSARNFPGVQERAQALLAQARASN